jgi:ribulose-phosphate 3-epimerase
MTHFSRKPDHPLVAASILSADFGHMIEDCQRVLDLGADLLHIDVMDGHFVSNLTMGQDMIKALRKHLPDTLLDVHLMVDRPGDYVQPFADAGADHFTFHLEVCHPFAPNGHDASELVDAIEAAGMTAGMAINPHTPAEPLEPWLERLAMVLVMSVVPGRSGQKFMPAVLDKTRSLAARLREDQRLEMDGGLSPDTAPEAAAAGCDVMVTASALFGSDDPASVIASLHTSG